jgi:import inner membrane translocase subunit TIM9
LKTSNNNNSSKLSRKFENLIKEETVTLGVDATLVLVLVVIMSALPSQVDLDQLDVQQVATFREFLQNFNRVSDICFRSCIWDFTSRTIKDQEERCTSHCVEKFLKANQRVSQRFQEAQLAANEAAIAQQQAASGGGFFGK